MELREFAPAFERPAWLSHSSAWVEHIPFAFFVTELLRPRTFVELGTHWGDSYCAFCQAVAKLRLNTQCRAIDTWRGDQQSGLYGSEVLESLQRYHDPLYGQFSQLRQKSFDDALADFEDGSIDLLHLDGLHTYEAVCHDWETWLPKLSPSGVLLIHDTEVKQDGFGGHRLWAHISGHYPSFEFEHGYGLGVAAIGREFPPQVTRFLAQARAESDAARALFAALGARLLLARSFVAVDALAKRSGSVEGVNLAPEVAQLLEPGTDLKAKSDSQLALVRGHLARVVRRLTTWARFRRP